MTEQPTATLTPRQAGGVRLHVPSWNRPVLYDHMRSVPGSWFWVFRAEHLARQFAARRGIRIESNQEQP